MGDFERLGRGRVPLAEVSGLASVSTGGIVRVVAVGDARVSLALADVGADGALGEWSVLTTADVATRPEGAGRFQELEAVAADGRGVVWVLTEETSWMAGVDIGSRTVVGSAHLDTATIPELDARWSTKGASRGEGLMLLRDGHVLVAKEKKPAGLVEFGPRGDQPLGVSSSSLLGPDEPFALLGEVLDALAWWPLEGDVARTMRDLSDLAQDSEGAVWLLSDQSTRMARLVLPLDPGDAVALDDVADLPGRVRKPEGLCFLLGGVVAVAEDRHDDGENLWLLRRRTGRGVESRGSTT
ncbi:MAG TPA: SdiA-regulated domain-containing protein [Candidatus Nanopelagicales bacterium]|nr:SdiA-regulated domain-containing protein [Candidatus Nanopelagicales bacterium]